MLTLTFTGIWVVTWFGLTIDQRQCSKKDFSKIPQEFWIFSESFMIFSLTFGK